MIPIGFIIFAVACGLFVFIWGFFMSLKEKPSFGDMTEHDKKAILLCHPVTKDYIGGYIELSDNELVFKGSTDNDSVRMPYSQINKCRVYWSRLAMFTGPNAYHYLGIFKEGDPDEYLSFRFNTRAYFYAKDLCNKIDAKRKLFRTKDSGARIPDKVFYKAEGEIGERVSSIIFRALIWFAAARAIYYIIAYISGIFTPHSNDAGIGFKEWAIPTYDFVVSAIYLYLIIRILDFGYNHEQGLKIFLFLVGYDIINTIGKSLIIYQSLSQNLSPIILNIAILYYFTRPKVRKQFT